MTVIAVTRHELAAALALSPRPLGLVPTMGALHDGHLALISAAQAANETVVVSIFVNPLQFGPDEDFEKYPRSFTADVARCEQVGVAVIWAPTVGDMYSAGPAQVTVSPGPLGDELEGALRPGHFVGMLTVVTKLLTTIRPDRAYFGEKDYQQLTLIRRLAADLDLPGEIVGVETVREADGLARSSRNVYLAVDERQRASALPRALHAGTFAAPGGADAVLAAAARVLADAGIEPDYLELRGADLGPAPERGLARLLVAARVGPPRLIDNMAVDL